MYRRSTSRAQYQPPMNCPFHISRFKARMHSYRELPLRFAELGTVYRFERSGVLHGLLRVRGFTQDDAHVFCRPDQMDVEILRVLDFVTNILKTFGFDRYDIYLSTKPEKASGTDEQWEVATAALKRALETRGLPYIVDPGEGVSGRDRHQIRTADQGSARYQWTSTTTGSGWSSSATARPPAGHDPPRAPRRLERFSVPRALRRRVPTWLALQSSSSRYGASGIRPRRRGDAGGQGRAGERGRS
jgi:hypothetical protein